MLLHALAALSIFFKKGIHFALLQNKQHYTECRKEVRNKEIQDVQ